MFEKSLPALGFLKYLFLGERVSVVVPCFNECATVGHVVAIAKSSPLVDEVIVVDDGSSDDSSAVAKDAGARVVRHSRNKGKGAAILSGARAARNSVLVFVDADFVNLGSEAIESLALPVLEREAELCKASFDRSGGRVTELTAKPLLEFLFPEVSLQQPLSGQFAVRKKLLKQLDVSNDWGIDIGILLDSIKRGERVIEVNIGRVEHKHRSLSEVAATSREVTKTILEKAGFLAKKHKLVLFDFDRTLVAGSSIEALAEGLGFTSRLEAARKDYYAKKITERVLTRRIALMLKGVSLKTFTEVTSGTPKQQFAEETLVYLRRMGYKMGIVSFAFKQTITACFGEKTFDKMVCPKLEVHDGMLTGKVDIPEFVSADRHVFCKGKAAKRLMRRLGVSKSETIAVGDSNSDKPLLMQAGVPVELNSKKKIVSDSIRISALPELLIIAQ